MESPLPFSNIDLQADYFDTLSEHVDVEDHSYYDSWNYWNKKI